MRLALFGGFIRSRVIWGTFKGDYRGDTGLYRVFIGVLKGLGFRGFGLGAGRKE